MSHIFMSHIFMSHVTHFHVKHFYESCHTFSWVMSNIFMSHVTRERLIPQTRSTTRTRKEVRHHFSARFESCHTHIYVYISKSCRTHTCHFWVISHAYMLFLSHVINIYESAPPFQRQNWVTSHTCLCFDFRVMSHKCMLFSSHGIHMYENARPFQCSLQVMSRTCVHEQCLI